jgi:D-galactarolactone cycloisomerase
LKQPFGVSVSVPLDKIRETLLVRIESSEGHVGWGETSPLPGTKAAIDELGVSLVGQNPLHYRRLWRSLWGANFGNALAVASLDMAINDLHGVCAE